VLAIKNYDERSKKRLFVHSLRRLKRFLSSYIKHNIHDIDSVGFNHYTGE